LTRPADALALARGDVRDGVASIANFREMLASRRVGPRGLAGALPQVEEGCGPLRDSLETLERALEVELAADPEGVSAVQGLIAHAIAQVDALAQALAARRGRPIDARERLGLEAVVLPVAGDLARVVRLVDLLGAPVTSDTTTIDFGDALSERNPAPRSATQVLATVEVRAEELAVGDARLVLELLEFAVATVARAGVPFPRIVVEGSAEGLPVFTIDAGPRPPKVSVGSGVEQRIFDVVMRDELPREADVVRAAARKLGIALTIAEDRRTVTIAL
jgi:hypothetical protein